jgi:P-type Ca2+ transporter type 2C
MRPGVAILSGAFVPRILFYGVLIATASLGAFVWALQHSPDHATTIGFMTLALAQIFHLTTARGVTSSEPSTSVRSNPYALGAAGLSIGLQIIAVYVTPVAQVLQTVRPGLSDWLIIIGLAAVPALVGQAIRLVPQKKASGSI